MLPEPCAECGSYRDQHGPCVHDVARFNEHREEIVDVTTDAIVEKYHPADKEMFSMLSKSSTKAEVNHASMSVLRMIYALLCERDAGRVNAILRDAPIDVLPLQVNLALLASTLKAKRALSERAGCYARIKARIERDEPARAEALLKGLE
jgi:hypothetical protein